MHMQWCNGEYIAQFAYFMIWVYEVLAAKLKVYCIP